MPGRPFFEAEPDYERNAGRTGFLYVARNNSHRPGVYKLGQTAREPRERINSLNRQLAEAGDLGEIHLVHAVAVRDALGQERQLFEALQERRIAAAREYFFADALVLRQAADAVALSPQDGGTAVKAFRTSQVWIHAPHRPTPTLPVCVVPERLGEHGGWIYVMQNFWHEPGIAIFSVTKKTERAVLAEINEAQRTLTSQLGFYQVVAGAAVPSTPAALDVAKHLFEPYRLTHRRRFVRAHLRAMRDLVERVRVDASGASAPPPTPASPSPPKKTTRMPFDAEAPPSDPSAEITVTVLPGRAPTSFAAWTAQCRGCGAYLRFKGAIGATAEVKCPVEACTSRTRLARLGASRVEFLG